MTSSGRGISDIFLFQVIWLVSALGAAHNLSLPPGIAAALLLVGIRFAWTRDHRFVLLVLTSASIGFVVETVLVATGVLRYAAAWPSTGTAPAWIVALWLAFGTTLDATRRLLGANPVVKSAVLGALGGPMCYLAGAGLGAAILGEPIWTGLAAIALLWAAAFPALIALSARLGSEPKAWTTSA